MLIRGEGQRRGPLVLGACSHRVLNDSAARPDRGGGPRSCAMRWPSGQHSEEARGCTGQVFSNHLPECYCWGPGQQLTQPCVSSTA